MLKKFQLFGFKSFAKKTSLSFGPGITAVVGPNGCGKSNLVDAFRWVLGEQSAKSLRGGKMPDIIFSGSSSCKPVNFAEASVTLHNGSGLFPVPFEEIEVTRRLSRSGDSDYFLNGKAVRLKEIQALLCDSGVGKSAFSIFEQGKVDQIIHQTPLERRLIIEEVAEITRFLQRKKEALLRLEKMDANFLRAQDIANEVATQMELLQVQSEKASHYKEQKAALQTLEKDLFQSRWHTLDKRHEKLLLDFEEKKQLFQKKQEEFDSNELLLETVKKTLSEKEQVLAQLKEETFRKKVQKEALSNEKSALKKKMEEGSHLRKKRDEEMETLKSQGQKREEEIASKRRRADVLRLEIQEKETVLIQKKSAAKALQTKIGLERVLFEELQGKHLTQVKELHAQDARVKEELFQKKNSESKRASLLERQELLQTKSTELLDEIAQKEKDRAQLLDTVEKDRRALQSISQELETLEKEISLQRKTWEVSLNLFNEGNGRKKALLKLKEDHVGLTKGTQALLKAFPQLKPLFECLEGIYLEDEGLLGALFPYAQVLVASSRELFDRVATYAKEKKLQSVALFCQEDSTALKEHFFYALKEREGGFEDGKGVLFLNWKQEVSVFSRQIELKSLEKQLLEQQGSLQKDEEKLSHLRKRRGEVQESKALHDQTLRRREMKLVEVNFSLQRASQDKVQFQKQALSIKEEIERLQGQEESCEKKIADAKALSQLIQESVARITGEIAEKKKEIAEFGGAYAQILAEEEKVEKEWRCLAIDEKELSRALDANKVKEEEAKNKLKWLEEEHLSLQQMLKDTAEKSAEIELRLEKESLEYEEGMKAVTVQQESLRKEKILEKEHLTLLVEKKREREKSQDLLKTLEISQIELKAKKELMAQEALDRLNVVLEKTDQKLLSEEAIEKKMRTLKAELEEAGEINFAAIEDYQERVERHHFLSLQLNDLSSSREELLTLIAELTHESQKKFRVAFESVRKNFQKNFQILFEGGEADLELIQKEEGADPGIEIHAQPPGKKMRSLQLLSGGEKCLTAMALLFALFEVKPAPFCLLDEMDAPLDDANIDRFLKMLKTFSDRCQFLIITHNKKTMRAADRLFGLTMQEKGVTSLLSLDFTKEAERKELLATS